MEMQYNNQRKSLATVMAIGTAVPPFVVPTSDFPDFYFQLSRCEEKTELKEKLARVCEKVMIKKRHWHLTEEILRENPAILTFGAQSLNIRKKVIASEVPKLAAEAASKAIDEWGQPKWKITHLVFSTITSVSNPGEDLKMLELLGLDKSSIQRVPLYQQGCYAGGTSIRVAKDIAENNEGARVLVVCVDNTIMCLQGPSENEISHLVSTTFFGDGASAIIVGADPIPSVERPIFQIVRTIAHVIPNTANDVKLDFNESGLLFYISKELPALIANNLEIVLRKAFSPTQVSDWNSIFWVTHPGGRKIFDMIEMKLGLEEGKHRASRSVMWEHGNMAGACLFFVMDEIRRNSINMGMPTTGEGLEWGIALGFGPGVTIEAVVLRAFPNSIGKSSTK